MTYKIVRFYEKHNRKRIIKRSLTLEEAQDHCRNPKSSGEGWFDGYQKE